MTNTILITGANGMLAWDVRQVFTESYPEAKIIALDKAALDITSQESIESNLKKWKPQWVINTAAYTSVDGAEKDRELAEQLNAVGPALLTRACRAAEAKLIHFSTDQVFDGSESHPRSESEEPNPLNHYAATKLRGEEAALKDSSSLVLRVQWLYGQKKDRFSSLREKNTFSPFADQWGAPTWTREIAKILVRLLNEEARGLFHFSYDDYASWAEVFEFVKTQWKLKVMLEPQDTESANLPAIRPLFSVLSNEKLKRFLDVRSIGSWKDPLKEFLSLRAADRPSLRAQRSNPADCFGLRPRND